MIKPADTPNDSPVDKLVSTLDEALSLLRDFSKITEITPAQDQSPASLIEQCMALCSKQETVIQEPVRTVHHFACTGGTLICKCIAAMPNILLLSEADPLSTMQVGGPKPIFAPTDIVSLMRQSSRGSSDDLVIKLFTNNLEIIHTEAVHTGQRLVIRDHAHSHFCVGSEVPTRLSFREIIASKLPVLSLVTVRHPLDSYASLKANGWIHFTPPTLDEYCKRYLAFMKVNDGVPVIKYEDFVENPNEVMAQICTILDIPFSDQFMELFSVFKLTGDSGRTGSVIEQKPRRALCDDVLNEIGDSASYSAVQALLKYGD